MANSQPSDTVELWITTFRGQIWAVLRTSAGGAHQFSPRPLADINASNDAMFVCLDEFSKDVWQWSTTLDPADRNKHLDDMAAAGRDLATALFGDELPTFVGLLSQHHARRLDIVVCDETFSPYWDFVRIVHRGTEIYLGDLVVVTAGYTLPVDEEPENMEEEYPIVRLPRPIGPVGLVEDEDLPSSSRNPATGVAKEISTLTPIVHHVSNVDVLRPMVTSARATEIDELNRWLGPQRRVVHFNCHGASATRGRNVDPSLNITTSFSVDKSDLHTCDLSYGLVNLNVCNSAVGTYSSRKTFCQAFHDQNAEATICTTGSVDDSFATAFAEVLYERLANEDLLTSMHEARRTLSRTHQHPMSLMYTFTGPSSFRLDRV